MQTKTPPIYAYILTHFEFCTWGRIMHITTKTHRANKTVYMLHPGDDDFNAPNLHTQN